MDEKARARGLQGPDLDPALDRRPSPTAGLAANARAGPLTSREGWTRPVGAVGGPGAARAAVPTPPRRASRPRPASRPGPTRSGRRARRGPGAGRLLVSRTGPPDSAASAAASGPVLLGHLPRHARQRRHRAPGPADAAPARDDRAGPGADEAGADLRPVPDALHKDAGSDSEVAPDDEADAVPHGSTHQSGSHPAAGNRTLVARVPSRDTVPGVRDSVHRRSGK